MDILDYSILTVPKQKRSTILYRFFIKITTNLMTDQPTTSGKLKKIYEVIASKELSFGCIIWAIAKRRTILKIKILETKKTLHMEKPI